MSTDNYLSSLSKKIDLVTENLSTKSYLYILAAIGVIFFFIGSSKANIISSNTIVIFLLTTFGMYVYFNSYYVSKFKRLKLKNKILRRNSMLDEVCDNDELSKKNTKLCNKYGYAKRNFYLISNLLLQKFNISE